MTYLERLRIEMSKKFEQALNTNKPSRPEKSLEQKAAPLIEKALKNLGRIR